MKPASLAVFCLAAAVFLAWTIDARSHAVGEPQTAADPFFLALGSAKEAVGDTLFIKADEYFHGGALDKGRRDENAGDIAREGLIPENEAEAPAGKPADWVDSVSRRIHATQHIHLAKEKRKEMLPFFKWATELDPHNIEAVLTTAYWLEYEFGNAPEAVKILEKGVVDNPGSWEIERELAKRYARGGDLLSAEPHFREAVAKSSARKLENFERVSLFYEWAQSAEAAGRPKDALKAYTRATRYFDPKTTAHLQAAIFDKIKKLSI